MKQQKNLLSCARGPIRHTIPSAAAPQSIGALEASAEADRPQNGLISLYS
jgi:hypothetical protein